MQFLARCRRVAHWPRTNWRTSISSSADGDTAECPQYIPSKLYEYFWARRPVLALTHQNAQLDALVLAHGGWVAPSTDAPAVEAALEAVVERWRAGPLPDVSMPPVTVADAVQRLMGAVDHG